MHGSNLHVAKAPLSVLTRRRCASRLALALVAVVALPAPVSAQVKVVAPAAKNASSKGAPKTAPAAAPPKPQPRLVEMTVSPAAAPRGALRYRLLPEYLDRKPGNRADFYHRAMLLVGSDAKKKFYDDLYNRWQGNSLLPEGLTPDQAQQRVALFRDALRELEIGAWRDRCEWGLQLRELDGPAAIAVLLPESQNARDLARVLSLRCRAEIAQGRSHDARRTLQTMFQLSRDVAETPTLINVLVGMAIQGVTVADLREFLQRADAPNMYWALTSLPRPFIGLREAMEQERSFVLQLIPLLRDGDKARSPEEWRRLLLKALRDTVSVAELSGLREGAVPSDLHSELALTGMAMMIYPTAKRRLIEWGRNAKEVEAMPVAQVVLLYAAERYQELWGDVFKAHYLPLPQAVEEARRADERFKETIASERGDVMVVLAGLLLPAVNAVMAASGRSERSIDELRIVEALRMYAAEHGRWPQALDEVKQAPIPLNPFTGKPFEYRLEGEVAILEGAAPAGQPIQNAVRYELRLRKAAAK